MGVKRYFGGQLGMRELFYRRVCFIYLPNSGADNEEYNWIGSIRVIGIAGEAVKQYLA